jgi:hypothetical protein
MATALAASLSLRGDVPSGPSTPEGAVSAEPVNAEETSGSPDLFAELPRPPAIHAATEPGVSSAWPSPTKVDEWDEDWAPSLSALGAKEPERAAVPAPGSSASSSRAPAGKEERAPFRLSTATASSSPIETGKPSVAASTGSRTVLGPRVPAPPPFPRSPRSPPESWPRRRAAPRWSHPPRRAFDFDRGLAIRRCGRSIARGSDRPCRRRACTSRGVTEDGIDGSESGFYATTSPSAARARRIRGRSVDASGLPDPYTSDTDLTRPLIPLGNRRRGFTQPDLAPLRPPPDGSQKGDVRHIVAVPPPTVGTVEDAPRSRLRLGVGIHAHLAAAAALFAEQDVARSSECCRPSEARFRPDDSASAARVNRSPRHRIGVPPSGPRAGVG